MDAFKVKNMIFIKGRLQYEAQSFYTGEKLDGWAKIHPRVRMKKRNQASFILFLLVDNLKGVQIDDFLNVDVIYDLSVW